MATRPPLVRYGDQEYLDALGGIDLELPHGFDVAFSPSLAAMRAWQLAEGVEATAQPWTLQHHGFEPRPATVEPVRDVHWWKTEPTLGRLFTAMRSSDRGNADEITAWGSVRGFYSDVSWYRERRRPIGVPSSMTAEAVGVAASTLAREYSDRRPLGGDSAEYSEVIGGRLLADLDAAELGQLAVKVDWHLSMLGKPRGR